jgi:chromosome segregation ATPase
MECQYCKATLSQKGNLTKHQKTNKKCLKIQGKSQDDIIIKSKDNVINSLNERIEELEIELENRDNRINEQDAQRQRAELYFNETVVELNMKIARLEGRVESSSSSKPTTNNLTTNNNSHSKTRLIILLCLVWI